MNRSKELLTKIAALRTRLDRLHGETEAKPAVAAPHRQLFPTAAPAIPRLTHRAAQLLQETREALAELRRLGDDPRTADSPVTQKLQRDAAGVLDVILRNLLAAPDDAATQLRHCEGLQTVLTFVRESTRRLGEAIKTYDHDAARVDRLADLLRRLSTGLSVGINDFLTIAREVADDAIRGLPLRFGATPRNDVARFAAHHGLAVARVQAWVLRGEVRQRLAESLVPALVHDVGMLAVPEDIVFKNGPLTVGERVLMQQHPLASRAAVSRLYPGGGSPIDAVADHHERMDGSGYPHGKPAIALNDSTRLLAACDVYAALGCDRPHRPAADPRTTLADVLLLAEEGRLDRAQAEKLMRLTFYPAGSVVMLTDGSIALVVGTPKVMIDPAKATVIALRDADGHPPAFPWPIDLAESNTLGILRALTPAERADSLGHLHPALV